MTGQVRLRVLAICVALALLAGCAGGQRAVVPVAPGVPVAFGDRAPHPWRGRTPADYPVHGIDVSRFQGAIDWQRVAGSGVAFAFVKATEGGDLLDPMLKSNISAAKRAGIPASAYHFFYHCRPAAEQARWFIRHVPRRPGSLPPVLDVEWTPTSPTCRIRRPAATIRAEMADFMRIIAAHYGQRPVIYTTLDFYHDNDLDRLGPQDFWVRSVAAHPRETYPGQRWTFWQYTSTGIVPGVKGDTDINAFAGSRAEWAAWVAARQQ